MMRERAYHRLSESLPAVFFLLLGLCLWRPAFAVEPGCKTDAVVDIHNVTRSLNLLEVDPRFAEHDQSILFLYFTGDPTSPRPWDYGLAKTDLEGKQVESLLSSGVVDYAVDPTGEEVLVLETGLGTDFVVDQDEFYSQVMAWQVVRLNLVTRQTELVERSVGRPLSDGYRRMGVGSLPDFTSGLLLSESPDGKHCVTFRRRPEEGLVYFELTTPDDTGSQQTIFKTESWDTYSHIAWVPTVLWLDEESFLTLGFVSDFDATFPQSRGEFSIVKVDLATREITILYRDRNLNPFPRFVLDTKEPALLFQRTTPDGKQTELCRLNLNDNRVDLIYRVPGELGQVRFSRTGDSVVLTQRLGENFDIIRLVLDRGVDLRFAGR